MGKKKVTTESSEDAIKSAADIESTIAKSAITGKKSKRIAEGKIYINATYNNTVITVTDNSGNVVTWGSSGSLGFSGPKKATPFAASKVIAAISEKIKNTGPMSVSVIVKGVGTGRDSAIRSLINQGFDILSIKDVTPVPHNGPRPPKIRRV